MIFNSSPLNTELVNSNNLEKKEDDFNVLPIEAHRESILEQVRSNQSVIVVGETGSGKTTRIPIFLLEEFKDKKIAITSPRVLPARSVSKYVASQRGQIVGDEVGLITREKRYISERTRITFMTDGILLNMLRKDTMLLDLDVVMVDEAHERSLNIDLGLGLLKQAQKLRAEKGKSELKIVVTSATIEEEKFANYFDKSPIAKVPGRLYPVDLEYREIREGRNYTEEAGILAKEIIDTSTEGDVLIFMPGEEEINNTISVINKLVGEQEVDVLPLFGSMSPQDQDKIFTKNGKRKIIVSTNIAETSVTIDGVKFGIDSGLLKQKEYNTETGIDSLSITKASKASLNQRMGRAGRTAPGKFFRLFSKEDFNEREDFQKPEIQRFDLGEVILKMKDMGIQDVEGFDFIDNPSRERIHEAIDGLRKLDALDINGNITEIGKEMARLQLRPDLSRMLIEAKHLDCVNQMVDICAMMSSSKQVFIRPRKSDNPEDNIENSRKLSNQNRLKISKSDVLTMLNIWNKWEESGFNRSFTFEHLLNVKSLNEAGLIRMQLLRALGEDGIEARNTKSLDNNSISRCLLSGIPDSIYYNSERYNYNPVIPDPFLKDVKIFPGSTVFGDGSKLILAMNIQMSEKKDEYGDMKSTLYARCCHKISINELKIILPNVVKEETVGSPSRGSDDNGTFQVYNIFVNGKFILQEIRQVEDMMFVSDVKRVLHNLDYLNIEVVNKFNDLYIRSGRRIKKLDHDYLDKYYAKIISDNGVKTEESLSDNSDKFSISLSDLISEQDIEEIEKESPKEIILGNKKYEIVYISPYMGDYADAVVDLSMEDDFNNALSEEFPKLKNARFIFRYNYSNFSSRKELEIFRDRNFGTNIYSSQEFKPIEIEKPTMNDLLSKFGRDSDMQSSEKSINTQPKSEKKTVEKEEMPPEKRKELVSTFEEMKDIISHLKAMLNDLPVGKDQKFKKDSYLQKIKELNSQCNAFIKNLEGDIKLDVASVDGVVSSIKNSVNVLLNHISKNSFMVNNFFNYFKGNKDKLMEAVKRNDVEIDAVLNEKILSKVFELTVKDGRRITNEEADSILIDLV